MPRRKSGNESIRSIQKSRKGEYTLSIPISLMRSLRWQDRQRVVVKKYGKSAIIVRDWPLKK